MSRTCEGCTACCEGWLTATVNGQKLDKTACKDCSIGVGCNIYDARPKNPCKSYKCEWLIREEIPEWMSPKDTKTIISTKEIDGILYLEVIEAGKKLDSEILTWMVINSMASGANLLWQCNGNPSYIGSYQFVQAIEKHIATNLNKRKVIKIKKEVKNGNQS